MNTPPIPEARAGLGGIAVAGWGRVKSERRCSWDDENRIPMRMYPQFAGHVGVAEKSRAGTKATMHQAATLQRPVHEQVEDAAAEIHSGCFTVVGVSKIAAVRGWAGSVEAGIVTTLRERTLEIGPLRTRVWEKGDGPLLGFFAGLGGPTRWTPFLERLSKSRRVVVPSLPGFVGGAEHEDLDDIASWVAAALDLLEATRLFGADLVGASVGGMIAAEVAALAPGAVKRLALLAPYGLFDESEPVADVFSCLPHEVGTLLCTEPRYLDHHYSVPHGESEAHWNQTMERSSDAAARLLWPVPDRGLAKRLHRVRIPTLLLWGTDDRVIAPSYAEQFARLIGANARTVSIQNAGHMLELDAAEEAAQAVLDFLS